MKKEGDSFDVTMGSWDGAEICELVGLLILSLLARVKGQAGLYRDDGIMAVRGAPRTVENIKKQVCQIFRNLGLGFTIEANLKVVDILDVTLNLTNNTYKTYNKPNNTPLYVHKQSNHPPGTLKNIPPSVNKRLSTNSSNQEMFDQTKPPFQKALDDSGYDHKLNFEPTPNQTNPKKRFRKRKIIWFNPPYSLNVSTKIGHLFLKLVDKHFPPTNPLSKIFNRNTLKVSYRATPNIKRIISGHNNKILRDNNNTTNNNNNSKTCNCTKRECPLDGLCLTESVIYQATVKYKDPDTDTDKLDTYIGLTGGPL